MKYLFFIFLFLTGCTNKQSDKPPSYGDTEVRLINISSEKLDSLVIHVTGTSYPIKSIAPNDSITIATRPTGETGVYIENKLHGDSLYIDVYFEQGYGGRIRAEISRDSIHHFKHIR